MPEEDSNNNKREMKIDQNSDHEYDHLDHDYFMNEFTLEKHHFHGDQVFHLFSPSKLDI